jgi:uncharacterized protein YggE
MRNAGIAALTLGAAMLPAAAAAQQSTINQTIAGTRLDVNATGEVTRVPDVAIISAGVVSRAPTASAALQDTANQMQAVLAALRRASIVDRDIQTSQVASVLNTATKNQPEAGRLFGLNNVRAVPRHQELGQIRTRWSSRSQPDQRSEPDRRQAKTRSMKPRQGHCHRRTGRPSCHPWTSRRQDCLRNESGSSYPAPPPRPMYARAEMAQARRRSSGRQKLQVNLAMTFELQ